MHLEAAARERAPGEIHGAREPATQVEAAVERLAHVPHLLEVAPDVALVHAPVVAVQRARRGQVGAGLQLLVDGLGRQHARAHRVVDALQLGHVHESGGVAGEQRAGDVQPVGHREQAALRDGLRAPGDALAALEQRPDELVGLELLQQIVRRERGVAVVEADDEADRDHVVAHRVDERAAALAVLRRGAKRPAQRVHHAVERLLHLPDLLHAQRVDLGVRARKAGSARPPPSERWPCVPSASTVA